MTHPSSERSTPSRQLRASDLPITVVQLGIACMSGDGFQPAHNQTFAGDRGDKLSVVVDENHGRMLKIFGPRCVGVTALCLSVVGEVQRKGGLVAFIDLDRMLDQPMLGEAGVEPNDLLVFQPESVEETYGIVGTLLEQNTIDLLVVDSVGALVDGIDPFVEGEELPKAQLAQAAARFEQFLNNTKTAVILTARTPSY